MTPRKWRLLAASAVLCAFLALFVFAGFEQVLARKAAFAPQLSTSLQLGPKIVLVLLFLLSAHLLGRWYCSILCPAGLLQEAFHRIGGFLRLRTLKHASASLPRPLLLTVGGATIFGAVALANFLDPIGLFGRIAVPARNLAGYLAGEQVELFTADALGWLFLVAGAFLLVVVPLFRGRWFCDVLCPVGALLGLLSGTSRRRIRLDTDKCASCGRCEKVCPTRCLDAGEKRVDAARCVLCLDCLDACKPGAIRYGKVAAEGRRDFLGVAASAAVGGAFVVSRELAGAVPLFPGESAPPVLPPGADSADRHRSRCVTCQACALSCPVGIIRAEAPEMRPVLDYDRGYCQYGCVACNASCPAGVIRRLSLEEKQKTRIAQTSLHPERCVVVTRGTSCGACAEVCPTHAVRMVEQDDPSLPTLPDFDADYCIGCGACYHVCPAEPRAFVARGLAKQETALGVRPGGRESGYGPADWAGDGEDLTEFPF